MRHFRLLLLPCLLGACGTASVNREYEGAYPVFEDDCPVIWMNDHGRALCPDPLAEFIFPDLTRVGGSDRLGCPADKVGTVSASWTEDHGAPILEQPLVIVMLAVPITIQVYFNSGIAYLLNRRFGVAHCVAGPSALIGASNFFELAVAVAISLFGFDSGAALATVVGVLIEVPVMLSVTRIVNASAAWYARVPAAGDG